MICNVLVVVPLSTKYVQINLCFEVKQIQWAPSFIMLFEEGGVRKVRKTAKPQNRTENNKKPQYRIEIYRNTKTAGCRRQDLQSFYPLKIRPAVYADINSNVKLLNYLIISITDLIAQSPSILNYAVMHFNMTCSGLITPITWFTVHNTEGVSNRSKLT